MKNDKSKIHYQLGIICIFFVMIFSHSFSISADETKEKKTICLNMIVKNETDVIKRCLASAKPVIDYWVIVDTGSTDGTQAMIKEFMKDVPGELHERPWINFGHNRNEALNLAKGKADYLLFIDADETFTYDPGFKLPELNKDFYFIMTKYGGTSYARVQLVNNHMDFKWTGVLHETVGCPDAKDCDVIHGMYDFVRTDGARSKDSQKFQKDAALLEKALVDEPGNSRYVFYLAQSYRDAGDHENALKNYIKRVELGGWDQEVFWSMLQIGILKEALKKPADEIYKSYYDAYNYRNIRVEPLYRLASYYRSQNNFAAAYLIAKSGIRVPYPQDILFVEKWIYDYGMLLEFAISAYWTGNYEECKIISETILAKKDLPQGVIDCVSTNLRLAKEKKAELDKSIQALTASK